MRWQRWENTRWKMKDVCMHAWPIAILESSEFVPLTYEVSEVWSLSSRSVRAWWALPRDGARSYLGRSPAVDDDQVRCSHRVTDSPLSANILSRQRTLVCIACSWSRKWSGSRRRQSRGAGSPKCEILWQETARNIRCFTLLLLLPGERKTNSRSL